MSDLLMARIERFARELDGLKAELAGGNAAAPVVPEIAEPELIDPLNLLVYRKGLSWGDFMQVWEPFNAAQQARLAAKAREAA